MQLGTGQGGATPGARHLFSTPYRALILALAKHQSLSEKYFCQRGCQVQGQPLFLVPIYPPSIPLPHVYHLQWMRVSRLEPSARAEQGVLPTL